MKAVTFTSLHIESVDKLVASLPHQGKVCVSSEGLVYLDVSDLYIHDTFSLLSEFKIQKPNYFNQDAHGIGAHISIFYPQEEVVLDAEDLFQTHFFTVKGLVTAKLDKSYYAFRVQAPTLLALRERYGLGEKLQLNQYLVDFHITVGVAKNGD